MSKKKITPKRMEEAFNLNEAHLDALVARVGIEAALKGVGAVDDKGGYELPVVFFFCAPKDVGVVFVVED